jgi:flagellin FlaB
MRRTLRRLLKQKRGMVGIEAAIVLIAFVIVAAAFSFMVVNMGLFATQRGRETIQEGILEASSPLLLDGTIYLRGVSGQKVDAVVVPLKTMGTGYVAMARNSTQMTLRVGTHTAIANMYGGINTTDPQDKSLDQLVAALGSNTNSTLFIGNSNGDTSLHYGEKGFLVVNLAPSDQASEGEHVFIEIRPEKGAPLSVEFIVPPELVIGWLTVGV